MAFAQVHTSSQNSGTGTSVIVTVVATTLNNIVVVHIKIGDTTETCTSVTDDKGNVYTLSAAKSNTIRLYQAYGVQTVSGATSITVNFSSNVAGKRCGADEYSGTNTSNATAFDGTGTGSGNGTALAIGTLTPTATTELIVSTIAQDGTGMSWTAGTNYTLYNGTNPIGLRSQYRLSGAATETAPATSDTIADWAEITSAFKATHIISGAFIVI